MFKSYRKSENGNFAIYTAVVMMVIILGIGVSIDLSRAQKVRTNMQDIADGALLAASRARPKEESVMQAVAEDYIRENDETGAFPDGAVKLSADKKTLSIDVDGTYNTAIMNIFGKPTIPIRVYAETLIEVTNYTDIVLVLDSTGSMAYNNRMSSLKSSANDFIDIIAGIDSDKVRMAVVPFAKYVNVGMSVRNEAWIDVPADYTEYFPDNCTTSSPVTGQTNCRQESYGATPPSPGTPGSPPTYGTCYDDGTPYSCQTSSGSSGTPASPGSPAGTREVCDPVYGPPQTTCTPVPPVEHKWHGCVGSRSGNENEKPSYEAGESKVPGFLDIQCGQAIAPLSTNLNASRTRVNSLVPDENTYAATGLIWGYRMLDENQPFSSVNPSSNGEPIRKALIFMTDGMNTVSRTGNTHDGTSRGESDDLSDDICEAMKDNDDIEIYSISFQVSDNQAKNLVEKCATKESMYYDAQNSAALKKAFEDIGYSLLSPRITR